LSLASILKHQQAENYFLPAVVSWHIEFDSAKQPQQFSPQHQNRPTAGAAGEAALKGA
jgi:hypothetical protein